MAWPGLALGDDATASGGGLGDDHDATFLLLRRCRDKIYAAVKNDPPPMTLPSVLSAVCIAQN